MFRRVSACWSSLPSATGCREEPLLVASYTHPSLYYYQGTALYEIDLLTYERYIIDYCPLPVLGRDVRLCCTRSDEIYMGSRNLVSFGFCTYSGEMYNRYVRVTKHIWHGQLITYPAVFPVEALDEMKKPPWSNTLRGEYPPELSDYSRINWIKGGIVSLVTSHEQNIIWRIEEGHVTRLWESGLHEEDGSIYREPVNSVYSPYDGRFYGITYNQEGKHALYVYYHEVPSLYQQCLNVMQKYRVEEIPPLFWDDLDTERTERTERQQQLRDRTLR